MVRYREDAYFFLEAYNPHHFSKQLGFAPTILGFKSRSKDTILAFEGLRSAPLGPCKDKRPPRLPSPAVPSFSKPLKKDSLLEDDSVDRNPKYAKWGSTRRSGLVIMSSPDGHVTVTKDLSEIVLSSGDEAQTEVVDYEEPSDCMITEVVDIEASTDEAQTEVLDIGEPSDSMLTEVADAEVPVSPLPTGVQRIESILKDSLKVAWMDLCSFVEGKSHKTLLVEEEGIMASFEALTRFNRQNLLSQGEELKLFSSKARHVRDARHGVVPPMVHDKVMAIWAASTASSSKLQHEMEATGSIRTTLQ
ncbi:hypothetical protein LIER_30183 [Lithospermum erythrorhizon]|uniref:Uncharacterized protein n=1 Tax=Lithospermum erythrorhizon TaxID=34254 RepID=A0AAV3RSN9_LITER